MIFVIHHPTNGTNQSSLWTFSINTNQTQNLPCMKVPRRTLGIGQAHLFEIRSEHSLFIQIFIKSIQDNTDLKYPDQQQLRLFFKFNSDLFNSVTIIHFNQKCNKMKQQDQNLPDNHLNQNPPQSAPQRTPEQKKKRLKKIIFSVIIVVLALICFSLSIVAMSAAVTYFSYMFSLIEEVYAKAYLQLYYSWFMAITYLAIIGFVIVVANTIVFFTEFSQKERILWIHIVFYLAMFICGIVALAGNSQYTTAMTSKIGSSCNAADFQCQLSLRYLIFRSQVSSYFIGYCICFFAYAAVYHYASYWEKRQKQQEVVSKVQLNNTENDAYHAKKLSNISSFEQN